MGKRTDRNAGKRPAPITPVATPWYRRRAVAYAGFFAVAVALGLGLLFSDRLWQREHEHATANGPQGLEQKVLPEKPPRPEFAVPSDASPTQRLIAKLRNESFEVAEGIVDSFPESPDALYLLGTVHQRHRNEAGAMRLWNACLQLDPQFAPAFESFGKLALAKGDYQTAEEQLRKAVKFEPRSPTAPLSLAEALTNLGQFDEAVSVLEELVANHPRSAEGWSRLGQAHQQLADYASAKRCYLEAIAVEPESADAHHGIAVVFQRAGEADEAQKYLEEFRRLEAERATLFEDWTPEEGDERRMEVTLANTHMTAGEICAAHDELAAAEAHWRRVAKLDAGHFDSRMLLLKLYFRQNRFEEALSVSKQVQDLQPDNAMASLNLGILYIRSRRLDEAEAVLRRAIELDPEYAEAYALLAQVQMPSDRDPTEAVALARTAVEMAPTAGHHYILATARWNAGETAAARADLEQAIQLDPGNREYREAYAHLQQE